MTESPLTTEKKFEQLDLAGEIRALIQQFWHHVRVAILVNKFLAEQNNSGSPSLTLACLFHDIGKIFVRGGLQMTLKTGKLTPKEFDRMKAHAALSKNFLKILGFPSLPRLPAVIMNAGTAQVIPKD